ncbi:MAG: PRTRC system protein E, partial [Bacteroides sp.]|nr:PRTRC system protein E [Bacteroides sp.]
PQGSMNGQPQPGMQTSIFPEQQTHTMNPEPVMLSAPQQNPQEMPQPVYGTNGAYIQPAPNRPVMQGTGMPQGATMQPYPQQPAYQPETAPYPQQQVRQPTNGHIPNGTVQVQNGNGREYQTAPATHETFCFDPEDENDRELLKEDPYAEYPDFPAEYRMKDEAQVEMVYC